MLADLMPDHLPRIAEEFQRETAEIIAAELERLYPRKAPRTMADAIAKQVRRVAVAACLVLMVGSTAQAYEWNASQVHDLADKIIQAESAGKANAVGDGGRSRGLMQVQRATWERSTSRPWSEAFDPKLNRQAGEAEILRIVKSYRARGTDPAPAYVVWTYNTGSFIKHSLPSTDGRGHVHPWTLGHPNLVYRSIYQSYFQMNKGNTANAPRSS